MSRAPVDAELAALAAVVRRTRSGAAARDRLRDLRWLKRLDQVLVAASGRTFEQIQPALLPVLRVAAYQLLFLDRVPAHAIVSEAVDEALRRSHKGAAGFVNAVLRRVAAKPELAAWPIDGHWIRSSAWRSRPAIPRSSFAAGWRSTASRRRGRSSTPTTGRSRCISSPSRRRAGASSSRPALLAEGRRDRAEPSLRARGSSSVRATHCGPPPSRAASSTSRTRWRSSPPTCPSRGRENACSTSPPRPAARGWRSSRRSLRSASSPPTSPCRGSRRSPAIMPGSHSNAGIVAGDAERTPFTGAFDRVVVDYPCTGTGTLRKHPELKWRWSESELERLAAQALRLLAGAAVAVAPGGLLVAISCSLEPEENEAVGERFLRARSGLPPHRPRRGGFPRWRRRRGAARGSGGGCPPATTTASPSSSSNAAPDFRDGISGKTSRSPVLTGSCTCLIVSAVIDCDRQNH